MAKHCTGCSHPTICRTHGCAAEEARRNKTPAPHAAADSGLLPPPDIRLDGLADYYNAATVLRLLDHEKRSRQIALDATAELVRLNERKRIAAWLGSQWAADNERDRQHREQCAVKLLGDGA